MDIVKRNIKRIIKQRGMTREALAELMGVTQTNVSRMISSNMRISSLEKLAAVLECDVADFFVPEGCYIKKDGEESIGAQEAQEAQTANTAVEPEKEEFVVYGFLRIGERIVEIKDVNDFRDAFLTCEFSYL